MLMNAMNYYYAQVDWPRALEYVSGGIAATGLLWEVSIWLSIVFIH